MKKIYLVEHFYSIQGEGKYSGVPSIFLRFGGCNLNCAGFGTDYIVNGENKVGCDSYYAVDKNFSKNWTVLNTILDIQEIINKYPNNISDIVITGGEPLIFANYKLFSSMLIYFKLKNFRITIETNGTMPVPDKDEFKNITYSIALKLSNSKENFNKRFNIDSIHSIIDISQKCFFKFTIDTESIQKGLVFEILKTVKFFPEIPVYCMPVGNTREELDKNSEAVVKVCLDQGYIYSDRLQIRIWDNKKGC